jgi:hypothetical protein
LGFPERVYTQAEVDKARELIQKGYKHSLIIEGSPRFKDKMQKVIELIKTADYYDFFRTYIRSIVEMEGFSQLREADAAMWANMTMLNDMVDAASYMVQKAQQMRDYLEGKLYYEKGEMAAIEKRLEFIKALKTRSGDPSIQSKCDELLKRWEDTKIQFP